MHGSEDKADFSHKHSPSKFYFSVRIWKKYLRILVLLLFFITILIINIVHYTRNSVFGLRSVLF